MDFVDDSSGPSLHIMSGGYRKMQGLSGSTLTDSGWDLNKKRHSPDSCFSCPSRILLVWRGGDIHPGADGWIGFPTNFVRSNLILQMRFTIFSRRTENKKVRNSFFIFLFPICALYNFCQGQKTWLL